MSVTVTKISPSQVDYYRQPDPLFPADENKWQGGGLEAVGLEAGQPIDYTDFRAVYAGVHPLSSDKAGEQIIPDGGYDSHEGGHHKSGYDLTISPDKSVSAGFALGLPRIAEAFHDACDATLSIADELATARRKSNGVETEVPTGNLIAANIDHSVTREIQNNEGVLVPDCNLHRHTVTINATVRQEPDGGERLVSLKATPLFQNQGATSESFLNLTMNSQLAANLVEAGYGVTIDENGNAKLAGIPKEMEALHSKRSQLIDQRAEELRENGFSAASDTALKQVANFDTRLGKSQLTGDEIRQSWDAQLEITGLSKEAVIQSVHDAGIEQAELRKHELPMTAHDYLKGAAQYLGEQGAFSKKELLQTAMLDSMGDVGARELTKAFNDLVKSKELVGLDAQNVSIGSLDKTYLPKDVIQKQKESLSIINSGYAEPLLTEKDAQKTLYSFVQEQRKENPDYRLSQADWNMMKTVLTSDHPHTFLHAENDVERGKAFDLLQKVTAFRAEHKTSLVSNVPASEQLKAAAVGGIERDIARDKALAEMDGQKSNFEALVGKDKTDAIRSQALKESAESLKRPEDRAVAGMIIREADDKDIRKSTGASLHGIEGLRNRLFSEAASRAEKLLETELDRQTIARQESQLHRMDEMGKSIGTSYSPKTPGAKTQDVIMLPQGNEQILHREREEKGIREIQYGLQHKWGGSYGSMANYHVRGHGEKHLAVGHGKSIQHGGGFKTHKSDKVIWSGTGKGNRVQSSRTTYGMGFWEKTKTKDAATGTVREIKARGVRQSFAGFTLFESKTQSIKETDKNGNITHRTTKTTTFLGMKFGKSITKHPDGTITETKWRGYEKTNLFGQTKLVITHQVSVTKPAKPSLFTSIATALVGSRTPDPLSAYMSRADQRGKFTDAPQEKGFNSIRYIAQQAATKDFRNTTVLTYSKARAETLNAAIRSELQKQGHLEKGLMVEALAVNSRSGKIETKSIEISKGDRIRFGQESKILGIRGGESGSIKSIDGKGNITVQMDFPDKNGNHERTFNLRDYRAISHDYTRTEVDKRSAVGKVIVDIHSTTNNKEFLAKAETAVSQGFDIRFVGDKKELVHTQTRQYDALKDRYRSMLEDEKKSSGIIGKSVVLAQKGGNSVAHTLNAKVVDYDTEKGTVGLQYKHGKTGKLITRTHSAEQILVNGGKLVLPESNVKNAILFKDTVFDRSNGKPQLMGKEHQQEKESGFMLSSAESRVMTQTQAIKEIARLEKDSPSERFVIIDGDRLNAKQVAALVRETDRQGNRAVVIGNSKELLGKSAERLQERGQNLLDMSKHPEVQQAKTNFIEKLAGKSGKDFDTRTIEQKFVELPKEQLQDMAKTVTKRIERSIEQMEIGG